MVPNIHVWWFWLDMPSVDYTYMYGKKTPARSFFIIVAKNLDLWIDFVIFSYIVHAFGILLPHAIGILFFCLHVL